MKTRVIENGIRLTIQHVMFVDDNLISNIWEHLRSALATSI